MELIQGSETSANYNLTPGKYPKENIQYSYILFIIIIGGIIVLYIYKTRLTSKEIFSPSNKIYREVGRAKDLAAPLYLYEVLSLFWSIGQEIKKSRVFQKHPVYSSGSPVLLTMVHERLTFITVPTLSVVLRNSSAPNILQKKQLKFGRGVAGRAIPS